ncbi:hypothetical protein [Microvirga rosea]|uniref:hypothetical protein n=1 Tax=Microvirga rosea TaxID=2715425 RepID=UPI001D0BC533|nr:hypothetical protein [Microvirga rosea]MCB8822374.1 hypothetical protein [Microvirga rosea]
MTFSRDPEKTAGEETSASDDPLPPKEADFEMMLKHVLSDEEARLHRAAKERRQEDRGEAVKAKRTFERGRERPAKQPRRKAGRAG